MPDPCHARDERRSPSDRLYYPVVPELRTDRLILSKWRVGDRAPFAELNLDADVMRHFPGPLSRTESDALVDRIVADFERCGWGLWALEERATGRFLGFTGLAPVRFQAPFTPATEVGWRLRRDAWGRGFATEAGRAALAFAFAPDGLALAEVVSFTAHANQRSRAVMHRLGMSRDPAGDFDHPALPAGHPARRHVLYRARPDMSQ
jgi:ribosomal-protein-alanine N-acetyltransferase